jgi:hypothetical protein
MIGREVRPATATGIELNRRFGCRRRAASTSAGAAQFIADRERHVAISTFEKLK